MEETDQRVDDPTSKALGAWKSTPGAMLVATVGGLGHLPVAPGTFGALAALPAIMASIHLPLIARLGLLTTAIALAIPAATSVGLALGEHDSSRIVADEFVGMWATLVWFPAIDWTTLAVGFVAFRLLDILKPPGAIWCHRHRRDGLGVVGDDLAAAMWTVGVVVIVRLFV